MRQYEASPLPRNQRAWYADDYFRRDAQHDAVDWGSDWVTCPCCGAECDTRDSDMCDVCDAPLFDEDERR